MSKGEKAKENEERIKGLKRSEKNRKSRRIPSIQCRNWNE